MHPQSRTLFGPLYHHQKGPRTCTTAAKTSLPVALSHLAPCYHSNRFRSRWPRRHPSQQCKQWRRFTACAYHLAEGSHTPWQHVCQLDWFQGSQKDSMPGHHAGTGHCKGKASVIARGDVYIFEYFQDSGFDRLGGRRQSVCHNYCKMACVHMRICIRARTCVILTWMG